MLTNKLAFKWVLHFILQGYVVMDIKLECVVCPPVCVWMRGCARVCVCTCVVYKLPTDKSPREVLVQVCVPSVWENWESEFGGGGVGVKYVGSYPWCGSSPDFYSRKSIWYPFLMKDSFLMSCKLMCLVLFLKDDGGSGMTSTDGAANLGPAAETCGLLCESTC